MSACQLSHSWRREAAISGACSNNSSLAVPVATCEYYSGSNLMSQDTQPACMNKTGLFDIQQQQDKETKILNWKHQLEGNTIKNTLSLNYRQESLWLVSVSLWQKDLIIPEGGTSGCTSDPSQHLRDFQQ